MIVVDTSAVLHALVERKPDPRLIDRLATDGDLHAPHLIDVEILHALRRLVTERAITADRATDARCDFADLTITRYPHAPLADRAWELRSNVTAYDAMFVVLAEELEVPLVTCDRKLARATHISAEVEVYPAKR